MCLLFLLLNLLLLFLIFPSFSYPLMNWNLILRQMLLCDSCDRGHHMYCLRPQLKRIPAGEWLCPTCKQAKAAETKKPASTRGRRKSTIVEEEEEDEEDEEEDEEDAMDEDEDEDDNDEEEEEEDGEEEDDEEDDGDDTSAECGFCWKPGKLVYCSQCPYGYHMRCTDPPLTEVPSDADEWLCQHCRPEEKKKGGRGRKRGSDPPEGKPPRGRPPAKG